MNIPTSPIRLGEDLVLRVPHGAAALTPTGAFKLAERLIRTGMVRMMLEEAHKLDQDTPGISAGRRSGRSTRSRRAGGPLMGAAGTDRSAGGR